MAKVSVIIPSRNERFLGPTVDDVLRHATGDVEVVVVLDGYWPNPPLPVDRRVRTVHRGEARGMRPAINAAVRAHASGEWLMKLDAHCSLSHGFDEALQAECDRDWIVVPRRDRLDPEAWALQKTGKDPIDAHYLSNPLERPGDSSCGLHGTVWHQRARNRRDVLLDEEMSSQGSCWFMHRDHWARVGPMDLARYGSFIQEFQELGLKTWLGGGRVMVNKKVTYLHLHKGKTYGRGYPMHRLGHENGARFASWYWMTDQWAGRAHDMRWLVERFAPVPGWPDDLDAVFRLAHETFRNPYVEAA